MSIGEPVKYLRIVTDLLSLYQRELLKYIKKRKFPPIKIPMSYPHNLANYFTSTLRDLKRLKSRKLLMMPFLPTARSWLIYLETQFKSHSLSIE